MVLQLAVWDRSYDVLTSVVLFFFNCSRSTVKQQKHIVTRFITVSHLRTAAKWHTHKSYKQHNTTVVDNYRTLPQVDVQRRTSPYVHVRACRMRRRTAPYAVWTGLKDHQWRQHVYSNDCPWDNNCRSTSFAQWTACWPPHVIQYNDCLMRKTEYVFFSLHVLYALRLPDLNFW